MRARSRIYHIDCFRCTACSRQLIPGDEFALREDGLFCKADHDVLERASNNNNNITQNGNSGDNLKSSVNNNNVEDSKSGILTSGEKNSNLFSGLVSL